MGSKNPTRFGISKCQVLKKSTENWIHLEIILMLWCIFSFWCDNDVSPFLEEFGSCRWVPPIFLCNNSYVYQACFLSSFIRINNRLPKLASYPLPKPIAFKFLPHFHNSFQLNIIWPSTTVGLVASGLPPICTSSPLCVSHFI